MWRTFDVGSVVHSLRFSGVRVAAGIGGASQPVTRARLAVRAEQLHRVRPSELVVTTSTVLHESGEPGDELVARLHRERAAAVAVVLDASKPLPQDLIDAADRLSLSVLTMPPGTVPGDLAAGIADAVIVALDERLARVLHIHRSFTDIVLNGGGAFEIATTLNSMLGCAVAVVDSEGRPTVAVPPTASDRIEAVTDGDIRQPIRAGDYTYGFIIALSDGLAVHDDWLLAVERAALAIAVRLAQAGAVTQTQEQFAAVSLEELIAGHTGDAADVAERALSLGWDLARPRAVLLASIDPPTEGKLSVLGTIAAAARATLGREAIIWTRSTMVAALVAPDTEEPAERRRIADALRRELDLRVHSATISIGVGRVVREPSSLPRSYGEARRAVEVGRWTKGRHVTEVFDQLGLQRLLASMQQSDFDDFVRQTIGPLIDYDRANHSDLVETLEMWLETRNMAEAARRIHVHYNTFKNRLERIEAILGPVLEDPGRALECEIAIYIARHYANALTSESPDA